MYSYIIVIVIGPPGLIGPVGLKGNLGPVGAPGLDGFSGRDGEKGDRGFQGKFIVVISITFALDFSSALHESLRSIFKFLK